MHMHDEASPRVKRLWYAAGIKIASPVNVLEANRH